MRFAVKEIKKKAGITVKELSEKSGVSTEIISMLEENSTDTCNSKVLCDIADALEVTVDKLIV